MTRIARHSDSLAAGNELVKAFDPGFSHHVQLYDETLRDGEQTPGVAFTSDQKLAIAEHLVDAGVTHLTLGFPGASPHEATTVGRLARTLAGRAEGWCVARLLKTDMTAVLRSGVQNAAVFLPSSPIHLTAKLGLTVDQALSLVDTHIQGGNRMGLRIRFALEDASRTPLSQVLRFAGTAISAGACMLTLPDTCGVLTPITATRLFHAVHEKWPEIPLVAHCHNDFGLATANTLAAALGGATYLQGALGGLGERAGNAALEELAVLLALKYLNASPFNLPKLCELARRVLDMARFPCPANKPILGGNAFAHESGIHVHGLLADAATYEPFPPELLGRSHEVRYGKHSGTSNIRYALSGTGLHLSPSAAQELLAQVREMAEQGTQVTPEMLVERARRTPR